MAATVQGVALIVGVGAGAAAELGTSGTDYFPIEWTEDPKTDISVIANGEGANKSRVRKHQWTEYTIVALIGAGVTVPDASDVLAITPAAGGTTIYARVSKCTKERDENPAKLTIVADDRIDYTPVP